MSHPLDFPKIYKVPEDLKIMERGMKGYARCVPTKDQNEKDVWAFLIVNGPPGTVLSKVRAVYDRAYLDGARVIVRLITECDDYDIKDSTELYMVIDPSRI